MKKKIQMNKIRKPKMNKTFKVPESVVDIFAEANGLLSLRERYILMPFGFRKAKKCAIESAKKKDLFWRKIRNMFPESRGKELIFHSQYGEIEVVER